MTDLFEVRLHSKAPKILIVDDEDHFRDAMKRQLMALGYHAVDVKTSVEAIDVSDSYLPEVVIMDQNIPGLNGSRTAKEIKKNRPEIQIILLAAYGSKDAPVEATGNDVFRCMHKPCGMSELITGIEAARQERIDAITRSEKIGKKQKGLIRRLIGVHNARPGVLIAGAILFLAIAWMPSPDRLKKLLFFPKTHTAGDPIARVCILSGYGEWRKHLRLLQ